MWLFHTYLLCPETSTARVWVASKVVESQNVQQFEGSYIVLYVTWYTIMCTDTELLNDIDKAQLLYYVPFKCLSPLEKKKIFSQEMTGTLYS
jgi:hypothetical protein